MTATTAIRKPTTLADDVYTTTRADILSCRLVPGTKLKIGDLCERFGVSLGAVREALSRLSAEGLAIAQPQRGYRVAAVSVNDLSDLTTARQEIEAICLERAIRNGTLEWESMIVASVHRLSRTPEHAPDSGSMSETWFAAHEAYHDALVAACDSRHLLRIRKHLYHQSERYRRLSLPLSRGVRDLDAEHRALATATLDRDIPRSVELIRQHIAHTSEVILKTMSRLSQGSEGDSAHAQAGGHLPAPTSGRSLRSS